MELLEVKCAINPYILDFLNLSPFLQVFHTNLLKKIDIEKAKDSVEFRTFAWACGCNYIDLLWSYFYIIGDDEFINKIVEVVFSVDKKGIFLLVFGARTQM